MRRIANYNVDDEPIAKGGMGQIFKGKDEYGRTIAVKEILPEFANDWSIISRIEKEVEFLVKVDHPSIVKLHAAFKDSSTDCYYIVMEFVEGLNIEQYVGRNGAISADKAIDIMVKILDAMQCVHNAHIIHRDIKPSNIMIRDNGSICLLDFGVAKDVEPTNGHSTTIVGSVIGTSGYMSPEQADGYAIDYRSDIYALGCVFFYMLTGQHAFNTLASEFETKDAIINNEFPRLAKYKPDIPNELQRILDKATAKNMTKRYSSCYEFMSDMRNGTHVSNAGHGMLPLKVSIGRDQCDIIMADTDRKISRHHADIELVEHTGGQYYVLTDCSSNGTIVNNKVLSKNSVNINANGPYPEVYLAGVPEGRLDWKQIIDEIDKKRNSVYASDEDEEEDNDSGQQVIKDPSKSGDIIGQDTPTDCFNEDGTGLLIGAYILAILGGLSSIFFSILSIIPCAVSIVLGLMVTLSKKGQFNGSKAYVYKKSHRILGLIVSIIAVLSLIASVIFFTLIFKALSF